MKYPTMRFVFDRKKVATKTHKGLVQIEVLSEVRENGSEPALKSIPTNGMIERR